MNRPPIVVVMGHVDHGKTTLLDYIRKTNIATREAGGITQSIGAYEIEHPSTSSGQAKRITFIDTPGHEAFSKMRSRGADVADIAILVVAADDGVQPQTKESITILQKTETPYVVAINKIDKPNANIDRVKNELTQNGVLLEGFGGNISWQEISAKTGEGISELLDFLLLAADLEDLKWNDSKNGEGVVIEAKLDPRRGFTSVVILRDGILHHGHYIKTQQTSGKIKILENFLGKPVTELTPSSPALITGWENLPSIGEEFKTSREALTQIPAEYKTMPIVNRKETDEKTLKVLIKADVSGSLEALNEVIKNLKIGNQTIKVVGQGVGDITPNDIRNAEITKSVIVGFRTNLNKDAEILAFNKKIKVFTGEIIYELVKNLEEEFKEILAEIKGELEVLAIFDQKSSQKQIIGGKIIKGVINKKDVLKIMRGKDETGQAKILNMQQNKKDVTQLLLNQEGGLLLESSILIKVGDKLICTERNV